MIDQDTCNPSQEAKEFADQIKAATEEFLKYSQQAIKLAQKEEQKIIDRKADQYDRS